MAVRPTIYRWLMRSSSSSVGARISLLIEGRINPAAIPPCRRHVATGYRFSFELSDDVHAAVFAWAKTNEMNATDVIRGLLHEAWEADK